MPLPTQLTIEVTTVCNITPPCVMCAKHIYPEQGWLNRDATHFPRRFLPKLEAVLAQLHCLSLYGIGEPLTCPDLFEFVAYVPETCHVQLTSNGWLLTPENRDRILRHRIAQVDFSLDAGTPATYRKIRHGDLAATAEKIAQLVRERKERGATFPNVILNLCLMRENLDDLPEFVRLAKRVGADYCYAFHLNQGLSWQTGWFDYEAQHCALEPDRHDARVAEAFAVSTELDMPFAIKGRVFYNPALTPPAAIRPNLPTPCPSAPNPVWPAEVKCPLPWQNAIVYRSGKVTNCCWQHGSLGSLENNTFEEIWAGATQGAVRRALAGGSFHRACLGKSTCPPRGRP